MPEFFAPETQNWRLPDIPQPDISELLDLPFQVAGE
jgi:hypothetical protein